MKIFLLSDEINFQAIVETNRGCPYMCSFCFWGMGGFNKKFRFFSLSRIKEIAEWCGKNRIKYIFCADSNFGIFERDLEVVNCFVQAKLKYGFPEKFRVCYAKNAENRVYEISKLLGISCCRTRLVQCEDDVLAFSQFEYNFSKEL